MSSTKLPSKIWLNGKLVNWKSAKIHVLTHALHYGTAIFEGMRCYKTTNGSAVFRMSDHYGRLIDGAKSYQFKVNYSLSQLSAATKNLIRKNRISECYLRPICYAGYKGIGLDISDAPFEFAIVPYPMGNLFGAKAKTGISCGISSWARIDSRTLSPHVKASANYLNSVLAKLEAKNAGYDEAIILSEEGHVSEGSGENLFMVNDDVLITPPLHDSILAGITRDSIIELARELGISVEERSILRDDLYTAEEIFLCGTAAEITPVNSIDRRKISRGSGKITSELRDAFFAIVSGKDERFIRWLDFV